MKKEVLLLIALIFFSSLTIAQEVVYGPGEIPSKDDIVSLLGGSGSNEGKKNMLGKKKAFCDDCGNNAASHIYTSENQFKEPAQPEPSANLSNKSEKVANNTKKASISMQIIFSLNSYSIQPSSFASLNALAAGLNEVNSHIVISGHTDASGSADHNLLLSQKRAQAVKDYLTAMGVSPERLQTNGKAAYELLDESNPYASINRRVNFSTAN
jgi:outer membrane protein OmpA-like peptidoglycan-associated protein